MSDYRVTVKVQNNNILKMIEFRGFASARQFCIQTGYSYGSLNKLINLKEAPIQQDGTMRSIIYTLSEKLNCYPEELFSSVQMETAIEDNKRTFQIEEAEMRFMLESQSNIKSLEENITEIERQNAVVNAIDTLTPREKKIINMRFGLDGNNGEQTLDEVGREFGITRTRVRQIEIKALRKLRHPSRGALLKEFC